MNKLSAESQIVMLVIISASAVSHSTTGVVSPQLFHSELGSNCDNGVNIGSGSAATTTKSEVIDIILRSSVNQANLGIEFVIRSSHRVAKWQKGSEKKSTENVREDI